MCVGESIFFCCIAITLLIRITEAMRAPEQVKKKGWFGLYAMKHNIFDDYFYWLQYEARAFCLGVWHSGNPRYQLHRISHYITHLLLCHVMPRKKVVDKK